MSVSQSINPSDLLLTLLRWFQVHYAETV